VSYKIRPQFSQLTISFPAFYAMRRLGGHFHVATGADFVFQRNDHGIAFALEKALEAAQQIFVDFAGDLGPFFRQLFQPRL